MLISCKLLAIVAVFAMRTDAAPKRKNEELIAEAVQSVIAERESSAPPIVIEESAASTKIKDAITKAHPGDSLLIVEDVKHVVPQRVAVPTSAPAAPPVIIIGNTDSTAAEDDSAPSSLGESLLILKEVASPVVQDDDDDEDEDDGGKSPLTDSIIVVRKPDPPALQVDVDESASSESTSQEDATAPEPTGSVIILEESESQPLLFNLDEPDYVALEIAPEKPVTLFLEDDHTDQNSTVLDTAASEVIPAVSEDTSLANGPGVPHFSVLESGSESEQRNLGETSSAVIEDSYETQGTNQEGSYTHEGETLLENVTDHNLDFRYY